MIKISPPTLRRLRKIKQNPVVWEGARCSVPIPPRRAKFANVIPLLPQAGEEPEYVLWADATNGAIRSMTPIEPNAGIEVLVRSLLQAIEYPQSNTPPLRPQKIVVNDRQSQFYLRGILQEIDITVEFAETLPLIEEILFSLGEQADNTPELLPYELAPNFYRQIEALWHLSPWEYVNDYHVIEAKLDRWDINSFYITFIRDVGLSDAGVMFYHNLDSIRQFRMSVIQHMLEEVESMEETFLNQDCIFMMFNRAAEVPDSVKQMLHNFGWKLKTNYPHFSILHPLEGERGFLQEEEVLALTATLEALILFFSEYKKQLRPRQFPSLRATYMPTSVPQPCSIEILTLVEESKQILSLSGEYDEEEVIGRYLIPHNSLIHLTSLNQKNVEEFRNFAPTKELSDNWIKHLRQPIVLIQNSRNEIKSLISSLQEEENPKGICVVPYNPFEIVLLITGSGNIFLLDKTYRCGEELLSFNRWKKECQEKRQCVVILAMGIRGKTRGNPKPNHILGYYELEFIDHKELGTDLTESLDMELF